MELTELEKAVQELDEVTEPPTQEKTEITIIGRLSKAMEGLTGLLKKSAVEKETPATTEKEAETPPAKEVTLSKGQDVAKEKEEVVDVTALLDSLNTGLLKSVATVDGRVETLSADVGHIVEAVLVLCKSQKALHEMIAATPKSVPMGGVISNGKGRDDGSEEVKKSVVSMASIRKALTAAANANEIEPQLLSMFHTQPQRVLELIPEDVAKSYNIPRTLQ